MLLPVCRLPPPPYAVRLRPRDIPLAGLVIVAGVDRGQHRTPANILSKKKKNTRNAKTEWLPTFM